MSEIVGGLNGARGPSPIAAGAIYVLIPKAMAEVGHIAKGRDAGKEGGPRYRFRGIDDVYKAIQPVFAKLGIFCAPSVTEQKREERTSGAGKAIIYTILTVQHRFYAHDGSFVDVVTVGEAMDSSDKSSNKAMSAAMKYAAIELLSIPTEENLDTENESHDVVSKAQQDAAALWQAMETAPDLVALDALVARVKLLPEGLRAELRVVYATRKRLFMPLDDAMNRGRHAERVIENAKTLVEPSPDIKPDPFAVIDNAPPPPGPDEDAREVSR